MATLEDLYRSTLQRQLAGQGSASQALGAAAHRRARAGALGVGSSMAGLSPFLAARQAGQAAAQASIGADVDAARLRAQEQAQALNLAQQQVAADRAREDRFLGGGLAAGAAGLGTLLSAFGGGGGGGTGGLVANTGAGLPGFTGPANPAAQPGVQALRASRDQRLGGAPAMAQAPDVVPEEEEEEDPLAGLFGLARNVAPAVASTAGSPLAGLGLGALLRGIG